MNYIAQKQVSMAIFHSRETQFFLHRLKLRSIANYLGKFTVVALLFLFSACSIKMNPADTGELKTYYIPQFINNAENTLPNLPIQLSEALKDKVRLQSNLKYTDEDPDIELRGTLVDFRITSEAPRVGETTAINRLTITLAIEYFNNRTQKEVWKRNFSFFYNFDANQDFSNVQETAIRTISNQLMEDIFNAAFSDW